MKPRMTDVVLPPTFEQTAGFTPGPWEYVAGNEHHGPYVAGPWGGDICDCYAMSNPMAASIRNGGTSYPVNHHGEQAEANARLIAACPLLLEALRNFTNGRDIAYTDALVIARDAIAKAGA